MAVQPQAELLRSRLSSIADAGCVRACALQRDDRGRANRAGVVCGGRRQNQRVARKRRKFHPRSRQNGVQNRLRLRDLPVRGVEQTHGAFALRGVAAVLDSEVQQFGG